MQRKIKDIFISASYWSIGVLSIVVLLLIHLKFGLQILDLTHTNWLLIKCSDIVVGYNGWEHFKDQSWSFPLGKLEGYQYPLTTNIGLTDSIPLMAILFKLLRPLFGDTEYQFYGFWILLSFLLQAFFAYRLLRSLKIQHPILLNLGAVFFLLSPVFLYRFVHPSLCMHWAVLGSFWLYFDANLSLKKRILLQLFFSALMAWTHPYAAAMLFGLSVTLFCKLYFSERQLTGKQLLLLSIGNLFLIFGLWTIVGYFNSGSGLQNNDFGIFSSNLNTLFNSQNITQLLPALPTAKSGQYEGFGYLGLGGLLVTSLGITLAFRLVFSSKFKSLLPLIIFTFLATLFAFSDDWSFNEHVFLSVDYPKFLTKQFRSSGRFIWILHYLLLALGIWGINKLSLATAWKGILLSVLVALQFWDVQPLLTHKYIRHNGKNFAYNEKLWSPALENAERIITYPPYIWDFVKDCDQAKLTHLAALYDLPITCGRTVYGSSKQKSIFRNYLDQQIEQKQLTAESQTLFLTTMEHLSKFQPLLQQNLVKGFIWEDYLIFLPNELYKKVKDSYPTPLNNQLLKMHTESLTDFISNRADKTILISAKDEASNGLSADFKDFMRGKSSQIDKLQFRRSYAAVFENGELVEEQIGKSDSTVVRIERENFVLQSGGRFAGNKSSIQVNGKEYSLNKRGMNVVILEDSEVVEMINYDTYQSVFHNQNHAIIEN